MANHRMVWAGRVLFRLSSPTPCNKHENLQLDQAAQSPVQFDLDGFQGWDETQDIFFPFVCFNRTFVFWVYGNKIYVKSVDHPIREVRFSIKLEIAQVKEKDGASLSCITQWIAVMDVLWCPGGGDLMLFPACPQSWSFSIPSASLRYSVVSPSLEGHLPLTAANPVTLFCLLKVSSHFLCSLKMWIEIPEFPLLLGHLPVISCSGKVLR